MSVKAETETKPIQEPGNEGVSAAQGIIPSSVSTDAAISTDFVFDTCIMWSASRACYSSILELVNRVTEDSNQLREAGFSEVRRGTFVKENESDNRSIKISVPTPPNWFDKQIRRFFHTKPKESSCCVRSPSDQVTLEIRWMEDRENVQPTIRLSGYESVRLDEGRSCLVGQPRKGRMGRSTDNSVDTPDEEVVCPSAIEDLGQQVEYVTNQIDGVHANFETNQHSDAASARGIKINWSDTLASLKQLTNSAFPQVKGQRNKSDSQQGETSFDVTQEGNSHIAIRKVGDVTMKITAPIKQQSRSWGHLVRGLFASPPIIPTIITMDVGKKTILRFEVDSEGQVGKVDCLEFSGLREIHGHLHGTDFIMRERFEAQMESIVKDMAQQKKISSVIGFFFRRSDGPPVRQLDSEEASGVTMVINRCCDAFLNREE